MKTTTPVIHIAFIIETFIGTIQNGMVCKAWMDIEESSPFNSTYYATATKRPDDNQEAVPCENITMNVNFYM